MEQLQNLQLRDNCVSTLPLADLRSELGGHMVGWGHFRAVWKSLAHRQFFTCWLLHSV